MVAKLSEDSDWFDQEITFVNASGFEIGDGICLRVKNTSNGGTEVIKRTLVARSGNRFERSRFLSLLRWWNCREGRRPRCALVHLWSHAVLVRRASDLYRIMRDVHSRRGLSRCQRSDGWHAGKALGLSVDVRLHVDRTNFRCLGWSIHSGTDLANDRLYRPSVDPLDLDSQLSRGGNRGGDHNLFLVAQYARHP